MANYFVPAVQTQWLYAAKKSWVWFFQQTWPMTSRQGKLFCRIVWLTLVFRTFKQLRFVRYGMFGVVSSSMPFDSYFILAHFS